MQIPHPMSHRPHLTILLLMALLSQGLWAAGLAGACDPCVPGCVTQAADCQHGDAADRNPCRHCVSATGTAWALPVVPAMLSPHATPTAYRTGLPATGPDTSPSRIFRPPRI